jgi:hypothetical protein
MAVTTGTTPEQESTSSRTTPAAARDSSASSAGRSTPAEGPTGPATEAVAGGGFDMLQTMSRMIYSGSYALAYGVVYATVFVAQSLPQENPVMHGFRDGGRAAMDELSRSPSTAE